MDTKKQIQVPKYKSLFRIFFTPPRDYQNNLNKISKKYAKKQN